MKLKLDTFQGPLELLYQLVKKNQIEISEISLAEITNQYIDYINQLQVFNLDLASEFMVIAAELLEIKARSLLPGSEEREAKEGASKLINRLKEYYFFKNLSQILQEFEQRGSCFYNRPSSIKLETPPESEINFDLDLQELVVTYQRVLSAVKNRAKKGELVATNEWNRLDRDRIKVADKTKEIMKKMTASKSGLPFSALINNKSNRLEIIVTFLSILELAKLKKIHLSQNRIFAAIKLY